MNIGILGLGVMGRSLALNFERNGYSVAGYDLLAPVFREIVLESQRAWRDVVKTAVDLGILNVAISASLAYFDAYRSERLPANLIQAQRDFFGAHTYRRLNKEGVFHTQWG